MSAMLISSAATFFATFPRSIDQIQGGYTALLRAAENGHIDCVRLLIERGANKEAKTSVRCAMHDL